MFSFIMNLFTSTPETISWSIDLLNDPTKHDLLFQVDPSGIPPHKEIQLRLAKEVNGWNPINNIFRTTADLDVLMACLESDDGEEWLKALPRSSILKQCRHNKFTLRALELFPDYLINISGILHALDSEVFEEKVFVEALRLNPFVVYTTDDDECYFLSDYKHWSVKGLKNIENVIGADKLGDLVRNTKIEYTLEPEVKEYLKKFEHCRVTRSMALRE